MAAMGVVAIDLDRNFLAQLLPSGAAMMALGAALIMVHHHPLADPGLLGIDRRADRDHNATRLVPHDHRPFRRRDPGCLRPTFGATVLVQVAAAHAGRL